MIAPSLLTQLKIMRRHTIRAVSVLPAKRGGYRCVQIGPSSIIPAETRRSAAKTTPTDERQSPKADQQHRPLRKLRDRWG
jgi:hypothetical protein